MTEPFQETLIDTDPVTFCLRMNGKDEKIITPPKLIVRELHNLIPKLTDLPFTSQTFTLMNEDNTEEEGQLIIFQFNLIEPGSLLKTDNPTLFDAVNSKEYTRLKLPTDFCYLTTYDGTMSPDAITNYVTRAFVDITKFEGPDEEYFSKSFNILFEFPTGYYTE